MRRIILAAAAVLALRGPALAADLPALDDKTPATKPAASDWAGLYLGIQGGLAQNYSIWNDLDRTFASDSSHSIGKTGGIFGGNIGYNWQDRSFVYGFEFDMNWVGARADEIWDACLGCFPITQSSDVTWLGSFRGRVGLDVESTLLYLTGGVAFGGVKSSAVYRDDTGVVLGTMAADKTKAGWTAGVGLEHMFAGRWTARAEVRYTDLGSTAVNCPASFALCSDPADSFRGQFSNQLWTGTVGLGYKF